MNARPQLDLVDIVARDYDATIAFYRRLGVKVDDGPPGDIRHAHIEFDGVEMHVDNEHLAALYNSSWRSGEQTRVVLGFRVPTRQDVDATYVDMTGAGYHPEGTGRRSLPRWQPTDRGRPTATRLAPAVLPQLPKSGETAAMQRTRYRGMVYDSARWDGFQLRPGDIVISTPPKCGTTWTQMICALLVLQQRELPEPLATISPWLDMVSRARTHVFADLAGQTHRRFVKTHTPLDGLPLDPSITYICVGRDPRDVALSMDNHLANLDVAEFERARAEAAAIDGIELEPLPPRPPRPDDRRERFWRWVDDDSDPTNSPSNLRFTLTHLQSFRDAPDDLDVVLLHYDDLLEDLGGQMRALARRLDIEVPADRWPELVEAATLTEMRRRADVTVPGASHQWRDPAQFFHKGTSGQWQDLLDDADGVRYTSRLRSLAPPDLVSWVHRGAIE